MRIEPTNIRGATESLFEAILAANSAIDMLEIVRDTDHYDDINDELGWIEDALRSLEKKRARLLKKDKELIA